MSAYITVLSDLKPWVGLNSTGIVIQPETFENTISSTKFTISNNGGKLQIEFVSAIGTPLQEADRIYFIGDESLGSERYLGTVTSWDATTQTLLTDIDFDATTMSGGGVVQLLHSPIIEIYVGHNSSDPYPNELPYQLLAEIQPEWYLATLDGVQLYFAQIVLNGYLRSIFDAVMPVGVNLGINYSLFNKVRLIYDGNLLAVANVAYSMLNDTVLSGLAATRGYLTSYDNKPVVFSCGETTLTRITNTEIFELIIENGEFDIADSFNNDFNNDFG